MAKKSRSVNLFRMILLLLVLGLWAGASIAQFSPKQVDSSDIELKKRLLESQGVEKVDVYLDLMLYYKTQRPDLAIEYGSVGLELATGINYTLGIGQIKKEIGSCHIILGNYNEAMQNLLSALDYAEQVKHIKLIADVDLEISTIYHVLGNIKKSTEYLSAAEKLLSRIGNLEGKAITNEKLGSIYCQAGQYDKALYYFFESMKLNTNTGNKNRVAKDMLNIGLAYENLSLTEALQYLTNSYNLYNQLNDKVGASTALFNLGCLKLKTNQRKEGLVMLDEALMIANRIKTKQLQSEIYQKLSNVYEAEQEYKRSLICFKKYSELKDSILNNHKLEQIQDVTQKFNSIKKEKEVQQINLRNQATINKYLIVISFLVLAFAIVFYWLYVTKNKSSKFLLEKNAQIGKTKNELIALNRRFKKAAAKAKDADRLKTAFLANMSHEIRTPLNSIIGFTQLLADDNLSDDQKQYIDIINTSGKNLLVIINDIIDISKIEAGQLKVVKTDCNINQIFTDLLQYFLSDRKNHQDKDIQISLRLTLSDKDSTIYTDDVRLKQILINLISNAIKFTHHGFVEFGYFLDEEKKKMVFFVKDSGIGMDPEKQNIIFKRFRQADGTISRRYGGTGLGLSISKGLVAILGGNIWVESRLGEGSTFYFSLPYKNTFYSTVYMSRERGREQDPYSWSDKMILIVEDDENNLYYLKRVLSKTQINIIHAKDGLEAVRKCSEIINIDIILMDIQLPLLNGLDATQQIRAMNKKYPIIAQTANAMDDDRRRCIDSGCTDYISKPIDRQVLLEVLSKYLDS